MNKNVIAFAGEYSSGKDHFCEYLQREYGSVRLSFSDEVRRIANNIFPWLPLHIDPEVKDQPYIHENNPNELTPRDIWLAVGKMRDIEPNIFVRKFEENQYNRTLTMMTTGFVITDFRTEQEFDFLNKHKIPIIKIELADRGDLVPQAFEQYIRDFTEYDARFVHQKDGTEEFAEFFKVFRQALGIY